MSSDLAISVRGLSKAYTIRHQHEHQVTLAEQALQFARHPLRRPARETFWALDDVSFDVHKGEVLGVIGRNGAGKSTLLKVLSRITAPTKGEVRLYGRVGSLLEVGTGFHPELTGRENVYLNGSILGMRRKEIDKQFDAIVDFAGVDKFLDTPVKRYSSGMYVRLAFAVAAHLETEILLVDEVLAVGDADFQRKCIGKMGDVADQGRTVLVVSHNLTSVATLCRLSVLLADGSVVLAGRTADVLSHYEQRDRTLSGDYIDLTQMAHYGAPVAYRSASLLGITLPNGSRLVDADALVMDLNIESGLEQGLSLGVGVYAADDRPVAFGFSDEIPFCVTGSSPEMVRVTVPLPGLVPGDYHVAISLGHGTSRDGSPLAIDGVAEAVRVRVDASEDQPTRWLRSWGWHRVPIETAVRITRP